MVPQAKGLLLILNMAYDDLADPRRLAKDARGVGSLGTGEVQARLRNAEDLQYVLYLVRQALDKQVEADTA